MAFIGNVPAESYITTVKDTFSGNGSTTVFTLSQPTLTNDVRVVVENVVQEPTTAYSVAGTTLTFTSAPPSGSNNVYVIHLGPAVQTVTPPETFGVGSIYGASDTDTAITFEGSGVTTFDQNGTEAGRFDASGNLLVGKTAISGTTVGFEARADGLVQTVRDSGLAMRLYRQTLDGDIVEFRKDNTPVGSIGTLGGDLYLYSPSGSDSGVRLKSNGINPCGSDGSNRDAAIDLGASSARFKDLYLSGGVYLGGTGSANKLDDYEEGEWTPEFYAGGSTMTATYDNVVYGTYQKIGNAVYFNGCIRTDSITAGSASDGLEISGLPFTPVLGTYGGGTERWACSIGKSTSFPSINPKMCSVGTAITRIQLFTDSNTLTEILANGVSNSANSNYIEFSGMYRTA